MRVNNKSLFGCDADGMPLDPDHHWNRGEERMLRSKLTDELKTLFDVLISLGGINPITGDQEEDGFYMGFKIENNHQGWWSITFLAWLINCDYRQGNNVILYPASSVPSDEPFETLYFIIKGEQGESVKALTKFLTKVRDSNTALHHEQE